VIIFSGWGILALVLAAVIPAIVAVSASMIVGDPQYHKTNGWPAAFGLWIAAVLIWVIGRRLNRIRWEESVHPHTGVVEMLETGGGHTLFFVPMQYWAFVWAGIGMYWFLKP
jgi:hypothetical protein